MKVFHISIFSTAVVFLTLLVGATAQAKVYTKVVYDLRAVYGPEDPKYCGPVVDTYVCDEYADDPSNRCGGGPLKCGTVKNPCIIHEYEPGYESEVVVHNDNCFWQSLSFRELLMADVAAKHKQCEAERRDLMATFARYAQVVEAEHERYDRCLLRTSIKAARLGVSPDTLSDDCQISVEDPPSIIDSCEPSSEDARHLQCVLEQVEWVERHWESIESELIERGSREDHFNVLNRELPTAFKVNVEALIKKNCD